MLHHIFKRIPWPLARKRSLANFNVKFYGTFRADGGPLVAVYKSADGFRLFEDHAADRNLGIVPRGANDEMLIAAIRFYYRGYSDAEEHHDIPHPRRTLRYRPHGS